MSDCNIQADMIVNEVNAGIVEAKISSDIVENKIEVYTNEENVDVVLSTWAIIVEMVFGGEWGWWCCPVEYPFWAVTQRDIVHWLWRRPIVNCYDSNDNIILPETIHHLSSTQLQIVWLLPQVGIAVLI